MVVQNRRRYARDRNEGQCTRVGVGAIVVYANAMLIKRQIEATHIWAWPDIIM